MDTFFREKLLVIILIVVVALCIIVGAWSVVLFDRQTPAFSTEGSVSSQTTVPTGTTPGDTTRPIITETTSGGHEYVKPTGKYIALTFDDGPSFSYTPEILDILEKYQAKATFFVNGYQLSASKGQILKQACELGCEIGNHTENHERLTALSAEKIYDEIQSVNEKIKAYCGYDVKLLRPPYGNTSLSVMQAMYQSGIRMYSILWNNDSEDWSYSADYKKGNISKSEAIQKTYDTIMSYPLEGSILLMHDIQIITPDVLEMVLATLSAEGYEFLTVSEMIDFEGMGEDAYYTKFYGDGKYYVYDYKNTAN